MTPPARKFAERPLVIWTRLYGSSQAGSLSDRKAAGAFFLGPRRCSACCMHAARPFFAQFFFGVLLRGRMDGPAGWSASERSRSLSLSHFEFSTLTRGSKPYLSSAAT